MNEELCPTCTRMFAAGDSYGAIVLREKDGERQVLMLSHGALGWVFPKNRPGAGESEQDAVRREVRATAGIEVAFVPGFRCEAGSGIQKDTRRIFYFLARPLTEELSCPNPAHSAPAWQSVDAAETLLRFPEDYPPLRAALAFLETEDV